MSKKKIFLIVGRSCVGKSSLSRQVCADLGLKQVKSYTTRPMRPGEEDPDNTDHIFITETEFSEYSEDIAAYTEINGYRYFTTKSVLQQSDLYVIDPNGVKDLYERCPDEFEFIVIYITAPRVLGIIRAECRGDADVYAKRVGAEDAQFTEFEMVANWDYCMSNNSAFYQGVDKLKHIIQTELTEDMSV